MSGRMRSMPSSALSEVGPLGADGSGDMAHARRTCNTSEHRNVAATKRAVSGGEVGFVAICATISSKARKDEKRELPVHGEDTNHTPLYTIVRPSLCPSRHR